MPYDFSSLNCTFSKYLSAKIGIKRQNEAAYRMSGDYHYCYYHYTCISFAYLSDSMCSHLTIIVRYYLDRCSRVTPRAIPSAYRLIKRQSDLPKHTSRSLVFTNRYLSTLAGHARVHIHVAKPPCETDVSNVSHPSSGPTNPCQLL